MLLKRDLIFLLFAIVKSVQFYAFDVSADEIRRVEGRTLPVPLLRNSYQQLRKIATRQASISANVPSSLSSTGACECMDYWECVSKDGQIYSYCGIGATDVCCFSERINKDDNNATGTSHGRANNEVILSSAETITTLATSASPPSSSEELFRTGNEDTQTTANDFVTASQTPLPFVVSSSPSPAFPSTTITDVDYYYSLENEDGDLKQITTQPTPAQNDTNDDYSNDNGPCGKQAISWELDSKAEFREWPWHVALLEVKQDVYICGGALISGDKVVTAAHCIKSYIKDGAPKLKVRAGEYDVSTNSEEDPYIEVLVEKIVLHPQFDTATLANDIAILKFRRPLNYSTNIRPICLPAHASDDDLTTLHGDKSDRHCVVTGWGRPSENSTFSVLMKEIVVPLWNRTACQEKLQNNFGSSYALPESAICAGELSQDACDGDGGGGLACFNQDKNLWELIGIVSFGIGCGRMDNPGVYTNVLPYTQWIDAFNYLQ